MRPISLLLTLLLAVSAQAIEFYPFSYGYGDKKRYGVMDENGNTAYWLLKKIQTSGAGVTMGELADYVTENVKRTSFEETGRLQTPSAGYAPGADWRHRTIINK